MSSSQVQLLNLNDVKVANDYVSQSPLVRRTPLLSGYSVPLLGHKDGKVVPVLLKMESFQFTGSFKIRGMVNCFRANEQNVRQHGAVTLSAGNAGRSFAFMCGQLGVTGTVCMPNTVPSDRVTTIEGLGSTVELCTSIGLMQAVNRHVGTGRVLIHPFDDAALIAGHASIGMEILADLPNLGPNDVIAVCCGGGGLVSGVASAIKLSGCQARVIAVEPEGCPCMHRSLELKRPAYAPDDFKLSTIAHGLAPPFAGKVTFAHVKAFVDSVVLVSDAELVEATKYMYANGFVCETSGCAGIAAVMAGKVVPGSGGRVVCVVSGRNISGTDLNDVLEGRAQAHD